MGEGGEVSNINSLVFCGVIIKGGENDANGNSSVIFRDVQLLFD